MKSNLMSILQNVTLRNLSNYKIGGPASFFVEISNVNELDKLDVQKFNLPAGRQGKIFVLGSGTNVLIADEGFGGLVIHNNIKGIERKENVLKIGAGELLPNAVNFAIENSLSRLEWAGGLPGTIGGAVRGNAGAFGGEIKDNVLKVESFDLKRGKKFNRSNKECEFGYRSSFFKINPNEIITSVVLKLAKGNKEQIRKLTQEKIDYRNARHPMEYPNIGSTFKNIPFANLSEKLKKEFQLFVKNDPFPVVTTTKLLALAGLKGRRVGDAQISEKHPNFIVNLGNAKASDVLKLIEIAKKTVKEKWGIELEEEIMYLA